MGVISEHIQRKLEEDIRSKGLLAYPIFAFERYSSGNMPLYSPCVWHREDRN